MSGGSATEEAARLIIKKYKKKKFGELINRGEKHKLMS